MKTLTSLFMAAALASIGLSVPACAQNFQTQTSAEHGASYTPSNQNSLIRGLGQEFPATENVSMSQDFSVYKFKKDGVIYIQINRHDGTVLTAIAFADGKASTLPIGELATSQVATYSGNSAHTLDGDGRGHQCPCSGHVVYSGPEGTIVVVTDEDGNVIQVITLPPAP